MRTYKLINPDDIMAAGISFFDNDSANKQFKFISCPITCDGMIAALQKLYHPLKLCL